MSLIIEGPVPPESEEYMDRDLDGEVLRAIRRGRYVNVRGGRQTGKTSLIFRMRTTLLDLGIASAYVDLAPMQDAQNWAQWLDQFASSIQSTFLPTDLQGALPIPPRGLDELRTYLLSFPDAIGHDWTVVLFLDEVATVPDRMRQPLFSMIRTIFNLRSDASAPLGAMNTLFVFAGTFNPERIIIGANSPFNVARDFDTSEYDWSLDQVENIAGRLDVASVADEVYQVTDGHPYLTNRLLNSIHDGAEFSEALRELYKNDPNIRHMALKLREAGRRVLDLAMKISGGSVIPYSLGMSEALDDLITIGLVKSDQEGNCIIRCRAYSELISRLGKMDSGGNRLGFPTKSN